MTISLANRLRVAVSVTPQDITTLRTGTYVDVSGAQEVLAAVNAASVAAGSTVTVQLMQATDASGTGAKVLSAATVLTAPAGGSPLSGLINAHITDLDDNNGFAFVAVRLSSNNGSAVQAGATLILGNNRFNP